MAKKKVTKKKTRSASGHKATSAGTRSRKTKKPATTAKKHAKTTKKSVAKVVAKKPVKKSAKQTAKKVPTKTSEKKPVTLSAATTSRTKKKVTTTASATSRKTSPKVATKPRSRSSAKRPSPDANGYVIINGRRVRMMAVAANPVPVVTKRTRRGKATAVSEPIGTSKKTIKTKLGRKELNEYRTQLLIQRAELVGDLSAMEAQALRSGSGNPSHMPIHMADVGTDTFDQDFMLGMAETERRRLREIDAALRRIEDRTYGVCEMSGKAIPKARLSAKPWARYTIESAREIERGQDE